MQHLIDKEVYFRVKEMKNTIEQLNKQVKAELEPQIKDVTKMHEVADFIDSVMTEEDVYQRRRIKAALLFGLFTPECFMFRGRVRGARRITTAIARELGVSRNTLSELRGMLFRRYRGNGRLTDVVDEIYDKVAEHYNFAQKKDC